FRVWNGNTRLGVSPFKLKTANCIRRKRTIGLLKPGFKHVGERAMTRKLLYLKLAIFVGAATSAHAQKNRYDLNAQRIHENGQHTKQLNAELARKVRKNREVYVTGQHSKTIPDRGPAQERNTVGIGVRGTF